MPTLENDRLVFRFPAIDPDAAFALHFQRTLRIPDTDRDYPLPPGFGRFPLRHVEDHAAALPARIARRGGVFLPMWQAEALWIAFEDASGLAAGPFPVAIKVAAGKVNAVTGEAWAESLGRDPQDYLVHPEQPWLDGFAVASGHVRQFVAMPLGEGYTAEEQLTGEDTWGGLQILVVPLKKAAWERHRTAPAGFHEAPIQYALASPSAREDMGFAPGGLMRQRIEPDPFGPDDWDVAAAQRVFVTVVHAGAFTAIAGEPQPTVPPSARDYAAAGLPWFEHYGRGARPLPGGAKLKGLKSVATLHPKKTAEPLPGSGDVATGQPVAVGPGVPPVQLDLDLDLD